MTAMQFLQRLGSSLARLAERVVPDPWVLAWGLTALAGALAVWLTPTSAGEALGHWREGFWDFLKFSMQMVLILLTGHIVASSPLVAGAMTRLAGLPRTGAQAVVLVAISSCVLALLNWGLGLAGGALLVREVGRRAAGRGLRVHYPLLGAAGYAGLSVWHGGLSGSAPLLIATPGHFLETSMGVVEVSRTLGSVQNFVTSALLVAVLALALAAFHPRDDECVAPDLPPDPQPRGDDSSHALIDRIERSRFLGTLAGGVGLLALAQVQWQKGPHLDLDTMNFVLFFSAIVLHGSARSFLASAGEGIRGTTGIILQYPFYAGIMGLMKGSGLSAMFSQWLAGAASAKTLPLFVFLSAGVVNLFVPSGGGQWGVQGPVVVESARALGVPVEKVVLAVAYGDQWTNLIQPFWALPLLGITGLKAGQIMGYAFGALLCSGVVYGVTLLLF